MQKKLKEKLHRSRIAAKLYSEYVYLLHREKLENELNQIDDYKKLFSSKTERRRIAKDYVFCRFYYGTRVNDYFHYQFYRLSPLGRREFIFWKDLYPMMTKNRTKAAKVLFQNKYQCYSKFEPYYKRDLILIQSMEDFAVFQEFCKKHSSFIVKPLDSHSGKGIHICRLEENEPTQAFFTDLLAEGTLVIEELIRQAPEMAKFHPESINTVRVVTSNRGNGEIVVFHSCIRMGVGGAVVDNTGSGGLSAAIDIASGVIVERGKYDKSLERCIFHPDSHVQILGAQIPEWNEAIRLCCELSGMIPEQKIVAWDLAFSDKGWVVVEGNTEPGIQNQVEFGMGARKTAEKYIAN